MNIYGAAPIEGFFGPHRFLSNFWPAEVEFEGQVYASVEHAYVAAKTLDESDRAMIRRCPLPGAVKRIGRTLALREDWSLVREPIMYDLVLQKFTKHADLRQMLVDTGQAYLEETNTWGDTFWGVCKGYGCNTLGRILMSVRDELSA